MFTNVYDIRLCSSELPVESLRSYLLVLGYMLEIRYHMPSHLSLLQRKVQFPAICSIPTSEHCIRSLQYSHCIMQCLD